MELAELVRAASVPAELRGDGATEISKLAYDSSAVGHGTLFFCVRGMKSDGHEFASKAVGDGAAPWSSSVPSIWACPRSRSRMPARRWHRWRPPSTEIRPWSWASSGSPAPTARRPPRSWCAIAAGGRRAALRAAGHRPAGGRRRGRGGRAHDPRGDRPAGDVRPHARGRRQRLCDGGLLSRAGPAPRRRDPLRGQGVHKPDPGPPRLPLRHGGLLRGEAPAVLRRGRLADAGDRGRGLGGEPGRRIRAPPR